MKSFISTSGVYYFEKDETNNLLTLLNVGPIIQFKFLVLVCLVLSDLYLFHFKVILNPDFICSKSLSSPVVKVTTGTYSVISFILDVASVRILTVASTRSALGSTSLVAFSVIYTIFRPG